MKRAVKMKVTPQQSYAIQNICFSNGVLHGLIHKMDSYVILTHRTYLLVVLI